MDAWIRLASRAPRARSPTSTCLCLQEVAVHFPGLAGSAGEDQMEALSAALPGYTPVFGVATDLSEVGGTPAPVRQRGVHAAAGAAGVPPSAALACRSGGAEHAAHGAGGRAGIAGRAAAGDQHPPRVLLGASACDPGGAPAPPASTKPACMPDTRALRGDAGQPFEALARPASALLCGDFNFRRRQPRARRHHRPLRR